MSPGPSPRGSLLEAMARGALAADGGMGTLLHDRGFPFGVCYEELAVSRPEVIAGIHEEYLRAGARVIETDTFGASRDGLLRHGLASRVHAINVAAAALARRIAGDRAWVAGAIGPTGRAGAGLSREARARLAEGFQEQAAALAEGGVDAILIETMRHPEEVALAVEGARRAVGDGLPIIAQVSVSVELTMADGTPIAVMGERLRALGCDVIGVNCCRGPDVEIAAARALLPLGLPVSAFPSAGVPLQDDERFVYPVTPEAFGAAAGVLRALGVTLVGGCCGTTPAHVAALS